MDGATRRAERPGRSGVRPAVALLLGLGAVAALEAQSAPAPRQDSVITVPGARYARGWFYRQLFGTRYRDAWTTPVQVPVLDLGTFAGGLTPVRKGGGEQTLNLRFQGADGRQYAFRSVDKNPLPAISRNLRTELTEELFQDQISAGHPTAPLAVAPILRAVGVLHVQPTLMMMPDDPRLGEFREEFANMLGTMEERPEGSENGGRAFAGAERIVDTEDLIKCLDEHPEMRVSSRDFLAARLTDIFLGDWDRHQDQWQWALMPDSGESRWLPLPRDRDQAFIRYDGLVLRILRSRRPQLVVFGPSYSPLVGATWNGRELDRRFLTDLERPVWDSVAKALTARITDAVIDEAVAALPPEHQRITGAPLRDALRQRRDGLHDVAMRFYDFLAGEVDVVASDADEVATVERIDDRSVEVTVRAAGGQQPYYRRRFSPDETNELRLYLGGGADSAIVRGPGAASIPVRIVGGKGDDVFHPVGEQSAVGFYDDEGRNLATDGSIDTRPYDAYGDTVGVEEPVARRDWGRSRGLFPILSFQTNRGFLVGLGHRTTLYRFRQFPYASRTEFRAEVGPTVGSGRLQLGWIRPFENSGSSVRVRAMVSGVEIARWYGFGNETLFDPSRSNRFYWFNPIQLSLDGTLGWQLGRHLTLQTGLLTKYTITNLREDDIRTTFIATDRPFGTGNFAQVGGRIGLRFETRADGEPLTTSLATRLDATGYPGLLDMPKPLGNLSGSLAFSLRAPMPGRPTLAVQVGGQKIFTDGAIPFHEAAFIGSWRTMRGFRTNRFAGDAALYGSAELRLQLASWPIVVPGRQGVFGFYDAGRVYLEGENSSTWHTGWGGGIWLAFRPSGTILSLAASRSVEGTRFYLRTGFAY